MKYAVIRLAGRQFKVEEGQKFEISKTDKVEPEVLLLVDGDKIEIGEPVLKKTTVEIKVLEEMRCKKVEIRRYKAKTRYRRKIGHRQPMMALEVGGIGMKGTEGTEGSKGTEGTEGVKKVASAKSAEKSAESAEGRKRKGTKGSKGTEGTKGTESKKRTAKG
ncbi:50S ribosomal protein L21 [Candidatus Parcubacteria bacterium]|nr:50S ribosomal protein L21 [Candidatus Parcubacteria bacterium]